MTSLPIDLYFEARQRGLSPDEACIEAIRRNGEEIKEKWFGPGSPPLDCFPRYTSEEDDH